MRLEDSKVEFLKQLYGDVGITKLIDTIIDERIQGAFVPPAKIKSPIIRLGGKSLIANQIVDLFPPHKTYVDVFGGAGHVLLAKDETASTLEVFNDKCEDITNLFKVIQDHPIQLRALILQMPVSRQYFKKLCRADHVTINDIEKAAKTFYLCRNGYYGDARNGFRSSAGRNTAKTISRIADELIFISDRFKHTLIECRDWKYILKKYDSEETLFYIDPPYILHNARHGLYKLPFTKEDNRELAKQVHTLQGKVIVSHYENALYNKYYKDYYKYQIHSYKASSKVVDGVKTRTIENLYCNFDFNNNIV